MNKRGFTLIVLLVGLAMLLAACGSGGGGSTGTGSSGATKEPAIPPMKGKPLIGRRWAFRTV